MKTVGVTGYKGRLGNYLVSHFSRFMPLDCDVTDLAGVRDCLRAAPPSAVLHLAAKSNVDWCENPNNAEEVSLVNLRGTFNVAAAASELNIPAVLMSSDHVFNGKWGNYRESHNPSLPVNQYGRSKLAAEALVEVFDNLRIIRTSYFFDLDRILSQGSGAYPTFLRRSFIHVHHLASLVDRYFSLEDLPLVLHLAGSRTCSWFRFMDVANRQLELGWDIEPRRREDINILAPRPRRAGLNVSLSKRMGFPQYSYLDGIDFMRGTNDPFFCNSGI